MPPPTTPRSATASRRGSRSCTSSAASSPAQTPSGCGRSWRTACSATSPPRSTSPRSPTTRTGRARAWRRPRPASAAPVGHRRGRCYRRWVSTTTDATDLLLAGLNPAQREAVTLPDGPALVIAGAGSGKTRVLTARIGYLLGEGRARPHEILAITFTNRAAAEMKERVETLVGQSRGMWVMTFHAACGRILRREADRLRHPKPFPPRGIHSRISSEKNRLVSAAMFRENIGNFFDQVVADVFELYERKMHASNAMDFDEMMVRTVELLEGFDDVRERWQGSFSQLLVDEYLDP